MVVGERQPAGAEETDFLYLRRMKIVRAALEEEVRREFKTLDLGKLEKATPKDQKRIVMEAFVRAGQEYRWLGYRDKIEQLEQARKAFEEGRLTLPGLLHGLEFKSSVEGDGRNKGLREKLKQFFKRG